MRLIDILPDDFFASPYLMELNIFNANEVKERIAAMSMQIHSPKHRKWFQGALFKALVNREKVIDFAKDWSSEDRLLWMQQQGLKQMRRAPRNAPSWLKTELDKGEPIYKATFSRDWLYRIARMIRWLNNAISPEKSVNMNWEDANGKAALWEERWVRGEMEKKKSRKIQRGTKTIIEYPNGWRWVHLTTPECVDDEGHRMSNCLKGTDSITSEKMLYSLRNEKGKSVITVKSAFDAVHPNNIKMKQNQEVPIKYYRYIIDLVSQQGHRLIYSQMRGKIDALAEKMGYINVDLDDNGHKFVGPKSIRKHTVGKMRTSNGNVWSVFPGRSPSYYLFDGNELVVTMRVHFKDNKWPYLGLVGTAESKEKQRPYALDILELSRKTKVPVMTINMGFDLEGNSSYTYSDEYKKSLESEIARLKGKSDETSSPRRKGSVNNRKQQKG